MAKTEPPALPPPSSPQAGGPRRDARTEEGRSRRAARRESGSQSRIPAIVFWLLGAALLFRIVTAVTQHNRPEQGVGLVRWQPLASAAAVAQKGERPVLYDFTAAWCLPCRRLDGEGWGDSHVAALVNDAFLPTRVVDRQTEEGKNSPLTSELQRRYAVNAFPTLVVADASGREVARMEGYAGKDRLVAFLEDARKKSGK